MNTLKLCVASLNPVKVNAAKQCFEQAFKDTNVLVHAVDAPSQVAEQPMSCDATLLGALNRVKYCEETHESHDYFISFEGGVDVIDSVPSTYAVVCISNKVRVQTGRSANLPLPPKIYQQLKDGKELGPAMDELFDTQNIKHKGGAIGQLTKGLCTRESAYISSALMTLSPFLFPELY